MEEENISKSQNWMEWLDLPFNTECVEYDYPIMTMSDAVGVPRIRLQSGKFFTARWNRVHG